MNGECRGKACIMWPPDSVSLSARRGERAAERCLSTSGFQMEDLPLLRSMLSTHEVTNTASPQKLRHLTSATHLIIFPVIFGKWITHYTTILLSTVWAVADMQVQAAYCHLLDNCTVLRIRVLATTGGESRNGL